MEKHEFGIMPGAPLKGNRYDEYEPEKYNSISIDDIYLEDIVSSFNHIDFYWHTLDVKEKAMAYCGVTLIPPSSQKAFINVINGIKGLEALVGLIEKATRENKWVIHYGL